MTALLATESRNSFRLSRSVTPKASVPDAGISDVLNLNAVGGFNVVLNPSLLADFRVSFMRYRVDVQSVAASINS